MDLAFAKEKVVVVFAKVQVDCWPGAPQAENRSAKPEAPRYQQPDHSSNPELQSLEPRDFSIFRCRLDCSFDNIMPKAQHALRALKEHCTTLVCKIIKSSSKIGLRQADRHLLPIQASSPHDVEGPALEAC